MGGELRTAHSTVRISLCSIITEGLSVTSCMWRMATRPRGGAPSVIMLILCSHCLEAKFWLMHVSRGSTTSLTVATKYVTPWAVIRYWMWTRSLTRQRVHTSIGTIRITNSAIKANSFWIRITATCHASISTRLNDAFAGDVFLVDNHIKNQWSTDLMHNHWASDSQSNGLEMHLYGFWDSMIVPEVFKV